MSGPDDILQDYLAECREHLDGIEGNLLAIEQGAGNIDEELVNKVFRAAHSIKGGAGFFDLADIRELAHKTENILDLIRSRQAEPSSDLISLLLQAFDKLRELIQSSSHADTAGVSALVSRLEDLASSHLPGRRKNSIRKSTPIVTPERKTHLSATSFDFDTVRRSGKLIYLLEYDLLHDLQDNSRRPLDLIQELMSYGAILDVSVDMESVGTLEESPSNRLPMDILYATALGPELLGSVVDVPAQHVWKVARSGACELLTDCAPWPETQANPGSVTAAAGPVGSSEDAPSPEPDQREEEKIAEECAAAPTGHPEPVPGASPADATVRLNVGLLDALMNLAGELVLGRNQLGDAIARHDAAMIQAANQRISIVTSEVQEAVMRTRMQPIGNLFQKFPRLVRDTARKLGKELRLVEEGSDVELDKTIIEGLSDPLTHMVRNAIDHGIEAPETRRAAGKLAHGTLALRAWHEAGLVVVEVADDGRGLDAEAIAAAAVRKGLVAAQTAASMRDEEKLALIFLAGVSTAKQVSDISGRGVGLDVVKANLDRLGGKVEIHSRPGQGTAFRIKLPLTLAIIPSLLVQSGAEPMAIPLVNVQELVRLSAAEIPRKIDRVGSAEVLTLREGVLPLVRLDRIMDLPYAQGGAGEAMNVVVLSGGSFRYGLVVERLHGTVEIVVKPLGRHLKHLSEYAGATILGDGGIALILDAVGLAAAAGLKAEGNCGAEAVPGGQSAARLEDTHHLLVFQNSSEQCAVPLHAVARVLKVQPEEVERVGGRRTIQHRGRSLPLVTLADRAAVEQVTVGQQSIVVVIQAGGREFGVLGAVPVDVVEAALEIDARTLRQPGVMGSVVLRSRTTLILDPPELASAAWPGEQVKAAGHSGSLQGKQLLVAEDSAFFREQVVRMLEDEGAEVLATADGQSAWELLESRRAELDLVVTDIEMPRMDGFELTRRIRACRETASLPLVMLTSLAGEDDIRRGREAGATAYCIKLDRHELTSTLNGLLGCAPGGALPGDGAGLKQLGRRLREEGQFGVTPAVQVIEGELR
jgi:two-component system, chemotaxis family, sensor kinase CheA